ncbi:hypothetical protein Xen7305DRAFT_00008130 [Xenococcus sp. PCC 7305]|uniref:DUF4055 domain-containing protein n=1 Tax=Xenococcus sp. PCC 7305 TaxID=102125 RepID=UPI0002AC8027|nr:DUF4055 domain-containing protein [Xenococcus sp. PCC 7305]ELS01111.1 hypothetical protein Xen7305DRAFT_00008130 [Xenococcus sp. PCC 7305]
MIKNYNRDPNSPAYIHPCLIDIYGELEKLRDIWEGKTAWYKTRFFYQSESKTSRYSATSSGGKRLSQSELLKNIDWIRANEYLPKETSEEDGNYLNRLKRSRFERKFRDFITGDLAGLLSNFSRSQTSPSLEEQSNNVDGQGNSLELFLIQADSLAARDGMVAILTDAPSESAARSNAEAMSSGVRAYWSIIERRDLINLETQMLGGQKIITMAVIRRYAQVPEGEYGSKTVERYRVYTIGEFVEYEIEEVEGTQNYTQVDQGTFALDYIPLTLYSLNSLNPFEADIPLLDYGELNIEHYQLASELREIIHTINSPPLQVNKLPDAPFEGVNGTNETIVVGPYAVIRDRDCQWVEAQGHGIKHTADRLEKVEQQMKEKGLGFVIGSQAIKTATEVEFNASQTESRLQMLAIAKESAFEQMARHWSDFMGESESEIITLDRELISNLSKLSPAELLDAISQRTVSREFGLAVLNHNKAFGDKLPEEEIQKELSRLGGAPLDEVDEETVLG